MKITFAFFILVLFSGCAAKKLAVRNADILIEQQVKKRLPLYTAQKEKLSKDVDTFLNDYKPKIEKAIPVIDEIKLENLDKVEEQYEFLHTFYEGVASDFSRIFVKYMKGLDVKQQQKFFEKLDEENMQLSKRSLKERMEDIFDNFNKLFGNITDEQKKILNEYKDYFSKAHTDRLYRRIELHKKFREIYTKDSSASNKEEKFLEAFEEYRQKSKKSAKTLEIIKKIVPTLTANQKESFRNRVKELKEMISYFLQTDF